MNREYCPEGTRKGAKKHKANKAKRLLFFSRLRALRVFAVQVNHG